MVKETTVTVTEEYHCVEKQLQKIQPTSISLTTEKNQFQHKAICTMMDGKTCSVLTGTSSSQTCNICKVTPKDINNLDKVLARASGHNINVKTFKPYCLETAKLCISLYGWYEMSVSVHKLLIHSSDFIDSLPLPVGQLSEDVLETSQKDYKNIRLFYSRKTSREDTNTDLLQWMLINLDPLISSKRGSKKRLKQAFNEDVLLMLSLPEDLQNVTALEEPSDGADDNKSDSD
nr:unnamed protein product [Callosobruchus analis]